MRSTSAPSSVPLTLSSFSPHTSPLVCFEPSSDELAHAVVPSAKPKAAAAPKIRMQGMIRRGPANLPAKFASLDAALHCFVRAAFSAAIEVRAARPADAAFLSQLSTQAFGEYDLAAARSTTRMMAERGARTLIAERSERPLGFAIVRPHAPRVLALNAIAVAPTERGRGVGQRLMQAVSQYAQAHGLRSITLTTAQANLAALDLFLRSGFVITDRSVVRYWRGQPACKLEKRLGP